MVKFTSGCRYLCAVSRTIFSLYSLNLIKKKAILGWLKKRLVMTYSPTPTLGAVPSALAGLTTLFGMGRGVSPPLKSPAFKELKYVQIYHLPETD